MINIECEPKSFARGAVSMMGERNHWTCDKTSVEPVADIESRQGRSGAFGQERMVLSYTRPSKGRVGRDRCRVMRPESSSKRQE